MTLLRHGADDISDMLCCSRIYSFLCSGRWFRFSFRYWRLAAIGFLSNIYMMLLFLYFALYKGWISRWWLPSLSISLSLISYYAARYTTIFHWDIFFYSRLNSSFATLLIFRRAQRFSFIYYHAHEYRLSLRWYRPPTWWADLFLLFSFSICRPAFSGVTLYRLKIHIPLPTDILITFAAYHIFFLAAFTYARRLWFIRAAQQRLYWYTAFLSNMPKAGVLRHQAFIYISPSFIFFADRYCRALLFLSLSLSRDFGLLRHFHADIVIQLYLATFSKCASDIHTIIANSITLCYLAHSIYCRLYLLRSFATSLWRYMIFSFTISGRRNIRRMHFMYIGILSFADARDFLYHTHVLLAFCWFLDFLANTFFSFISPLLL